MRLLWLLTIVGVLGGLHAWSQRAQRQGLLPGDPRVHTGEQRIVMLTADWCGYCRKQQFDFERANVRYRTIDFDTAQGRRTAQALGVRSVPATVIGQHLVRGYDTAALDQKLTPLGYDIY
ncbi:MAG: glutaredoxin family protein [Pseudomonadota bacterium]|nr:glutaredoxin family protein [Pseudomonadota bacterium]